MKKRPFSEQMVQRAVCGHLYARAQPGLVWFHVPNGGYRKPIEAAILKGLGVRPGVADLIFLYCGCFYALELKATKGRLTDAQGQFMREVLVAQGFVACATGVDEAVEQLVEWGLIR